MNVSLGLACDTVPLASLKQNEAVLRTVDHILTKAFNEDPSEFVFSDDQRL